MNKVNSFNMTKAEIDATYPNEYTQEQIKQLNKHYCYIEQGYNHGLCKVCGKLTHLVLEDDQ